MKRPARVIAILLSLSGPTFAQSAQTPNTEKAPIATPVQAEAVKKTEQDSDKPASMPEALKAPVEQLTPAEVEKAPGSPWWDKLLQPGVAALAGLGGALIGALVGRWNTVAAINQKANELEIKEIQTRLNDFYGRFQQVAEENHLIAREFKAHQGDPAMRTLLKLLNPGWRDTLSLSDKAIVKSLVDNGNMLRSLIREKAGLVDSAILPYLSRAALHFSMLDLAEKGELENEPQRFGRFVYPTVLDGVLQLEMSRLNCRIRRLVENSSSSHPPLENLKIPQELALPEWS
ncbi:hypothetical protein GOL26_09485 [Sinorhizobium medicae]|uniref:hypothetical protein n=1 Tax=Rhizobium leguminosarum TaxID=384 RepID=UPI001C94AF9E|nr:hypothetical protein [Rhizobium leguminosarum]MBY5701204.1 hypothetical protein [Rhizobium leguminosarum]MDX0995165.1 hypothetical protein [Sinorhizobium medicae]MDX1179025.1 hypothetical protein [Sinorhizobium medicae]